MLTHVFNSLRRAGLALCCCLLAADALAASDEPKVTIDVGVFDGHGSPVKDLAAPDFVVKVKGQARKVTAAEFVSVNPEDPGAGASGAAGAGEGPRWIVIAVDESSLFENSERDVREVAGRVLDRVAPTDQVLVLPLPIRSDMSAEFTSNVNEAQSAIAKIVGRRHPELVHLDMTAGEALQVADQGGSGTIAGLTTRFCPQHEQRDICVRSVLEAAIDGATTMQNSAKEVFIALAQVVDQLRERRGSKTVIVLTAGTAISKRWAALDELARRAAFGEVTVQGVLVEPRVQPRGHVAVANPLLDRGEFMRRLTYVTEVTRGGIFRSSGKESETTQVLDRIMQETTGWYRLQIEPAATDTAATIANAAISVSGSRKDLTVRARPLLIRGAADSVAPPADTAAVLGGTPESGGAPAAGANAATSTGSPSAAGGALDPFGAVALTSIAATMVPAFGKEQVLAPPVVGAFLDQLLGRSTKQSSALKDAVAAVREGKEPALAELAKADLPAAAFLHGIGLFAQADLEAAAGQFRESLRAAPDFYPAMFYLGACYAAGHRDKEAVGAWQTALITQGDVPVVYLLLADAWLRLRDAARATDFLEEATEHWPEDQRFVTRRVAATLMAGQPEMALTTIDRILLQLPSPSQVDPDLLLGGIRLLHDALLAKHPIVSIDDDRGRAQHYGEVYKTLKGAPQEQVTRWLAEIKDLKAR
jgi:VWFA-related protein